MANPILKRAMEKRDEALREAERWEEWIKAYAELSEPTADSLDIPIAHRGSPKPEVSEPRDIGPSLRVAADVIETGNGATIWPRA
jgi:hypothetical protein